MIAKFAVGFALVLAAAAAQAKDKPAVHLDCTIADKDTISPGICSALRDRIATSPRYREAVGNEFRLELSLVSLVATEYSSAQAVTLTYGEGGKSQVFVQLWVSVTGTDKIANKAEKIFAEFDQEATKLEGD